MKYMATFEVVDNTKYYFTRAQSKTVKASHLVPILLTGWAPIILKEKNYPFFKGMGPSDLHETP